ncbi:Leader peptide [Escherichia coli]|uniref:Leader peptide n=1 Tax=Escherichia coli TaxID=562 RepID=Q47345_ECOLX|nr:leader peptide [Escherichia coli K-12]CAI4147700.1 Leader peptide [Escherichia coli]CAI6167034.1 Leader peptide [Escherichia coli]CAI6167413.1 Leader peptide [Escherichia coli]CAI6168138.1 Leader peptide [Escherichia coli]
MLNSPRREDKR